MTTSELYKLALKKFGARNQIVVCIEECAELQKELSKELRGFGITENIAEEIADVQIMVEQMINLFDIENEVTSWRKKKLERLESRINNE